MYKKGELSTIATLERELKTLRKGSGITPWKLASTSALKLAIAKQTSTNAALLTGDQILSYLQNEAEKLGDTPEGQALRSAFALGMQDNPGQLMLRRRHFAKTYGKHPDTIEAYENRGIQEIARQLATQPSEGQSAGQSLSTAPVPFSENRIARNMLVQGLGDSFQLGPHASEIMRLFGNGKPPHLNVDVDIVLSASEKGEDWYAYKLRYAFQADIPSIRLGVVTSSHASDVLMASGLVDDTIKIDEDTDFSTEIPRILECSYLVATKDGVRRVLNFQEYSPEARRQLLQTVWQLDAEDCRILEVHIPEVLRGPEVIYEHYWQFDLSLKIGRYIYWSTPRLAYLNSVSVDATRFPQRDRWQFYSYSFLGPTFPGTLEQANHRYTVPTHSWIVQGHGLMLIWSDKTEPTQ